MDAFVYGTLTDPATAAEVLDDHAYRGRAVIDGLHRVDGAYPTLAPGGSVAGRLLRTGDVAALDRYEGVDRGLYVRVSVPLADAGLVGDPADSAGERTGTGGGDSGGVGTVETYVGDPDRLDAPADWPGDERFPERVRAFVDDHDVFVSALDE